MRQSVPPKCQRFPADRQRLLDDLLDKNSEGTITAEERVMLEQLVAEAQELMVGNARRLAEFAQTEPPSGRAGAMPVTVWVQPEHVKS